MTIPKIIWIKDRDINGNYGFRNVITGQFRRSLDENKKYNQAVLKSYSSKKAKFDDTQSKIRNHSDERIKKHVNIPKIYMDKNGRSHQTTVKSLAPNEDSAKIDNTIEGLFVGDKVFKLGSGILKLGLAKTNNNFIGNWARNSLDNQYFKIPNLNPDMRLYYDETLKIPIEKGFLYRTYNPTRYKIKNGRIYIADSGCGEVKIVNGKYKSVSVPHGNNPDKLWWDPNGHNYGDIVQVTKEENAQTMKEAIRNGFQPSYLVPNTDYRLSDPIDINKVLTFKYDPVFCTYIPSMPGKIINNKQSISQIFNQYGK